jgi:hypothetical protein
MTRDEIIIKVKQKLGEVTTFDVGEIADETLIDSLLDPGARDVLLKAPLHLINGTTFSTTPTSPVDGSLSIELDNKYLKLHNLKLAENKKLFTEADVIKEGSPNYKYINYPSTRGSISKPKIYFTSKGGRKYLYIYGGAYEDGYYVKEVVAEALQENLIEPLAWKVAGDVLLVLGDEAAANCYAKEEEFFKIS